MPIIRSLAVCGLAAGVAGCSIHPLPDDVTNDTTFTIVQKIRCEARDALRQEVADELLTSSDPQTIQIGQAVLDGDRDIGTLKLEELRPEAVRMAVATYAQSAIAYEFTFEITEDNNNNGLLNLRDPFGRGFFSLSIGSVTHNRQRKSNRNFLISEYFSTLALNLSAKTCKSSGTRNKDWIYPITGRIGLAESIDTFLELDRRIGLYPKGKDASPTFADTLTFETEMSGSLGPSITLTPVTSRLHVSGGSGTFSAKRKDSHKVVVTLSSPPDPEPKKTGAAFGAARSTAATTTIQSAVNEVERQRQIEFFRTQEEILDRLDETQ